MEFIPKLRGNCKDVVSCKLILPFSAVSNVMPLKVDISADISSHLLQPELPEIATGARLELWVAQMPLAVPFHFKLNSKTLRASW